MTEYILTASGIYAIRNTVNNKRYVGSAKCFKNRFQAHLRELKRNSHHSVKLQNAWNKYGKDSFVFEVLEYVIDINWLLIKEQNYLDKFKSATQSGYNDCPYAGSKLGTTLRQESKDKIGNANRGYKHTEENKKRISVLSTGRKHSESAKEKCRIAVVGRKHTPEAIENMRIAQSNKKISAEHMAKLQAGRKAHKITEETREKLSLSSSAKRHSEESKEKIRQIVTAYWQNKRLLASA